MSIYEKTSLLGLRMSQLANGAPSTLSKNDLETCKNEKEIARLELEKKVIPLKIVRESVAYNVNDMIII
jgi:DNA-directed RNA polymerase subunit K/omega